MAEIFTKQLPCAVRDGVLVQGTVTSLRAVARALVHFPPEESAQLVRLEQHLRLSAGAGFHAVEPGVNTIVCLTTFAELGSAPPETLQQCLSWCLLSERHLASGVPLFPLLLSGYRDSAKGHDAAILQALDCLLVCPAATSVLGLALLGHLALSIVAGDSLVPQMAPPAPGSKSLVLLDPTYGGLDQKSDAIFGASANWTWGDAGVDSCLRTLALTLPSLFASRNPDKGQVQVLKRLLTLLRSDKPAACEEAIRASLMTLSHLAFFHDASNWLLLASA